MVTTFLVGLVSLVLVFASASGPLTLPEQQVLTSHNAYRLAAGLRPLALDATLTAVARARSADMVSRDYFAHTSPSGQTAYKLMAALSYSYTLAGENIGRNNYPDDASVGAIMAAFMNSPDHRDNVLDRHFSRVGVGVAVGPGGMKYYTIVFADR